MDDQSDNGISTHSDDADEQTVASDSDNWGQDAILEWDAEWESEAVDNEQNAMEVTTEEDDDDQGEEIHDIDAISGDDEPSHGSTMPMYEEWDTMRLQVSVSTSAALTPAPGQQVWVP